MAYDITHKNSTVAGTPPTAAEVELGEIAINAADAELYVKDTNGNIRKFQNTTTGTADGVNFTQAGTGAVQRTVESKLQDVVSVRDFGAVGDGVADDTAAFNTAIAYANSKGGTDRSNIIGTTIFVPSGRYRITAALSPITVSSVFINGDTNGSSVLLCSSAAEVFTFGDSTLSNAVVGGGACNLKIEYPAGPSGTPVVFKIDYAFSLVFQDLMLHKVGTLLSLGQSNTRVASIVTVRNVKGNIANFGAPLFDVKWGSGLFVTDCQIYVDGVGVPTHPNPIATVPGTSVFRMITGFWDTLQVTNCLFERFDFGVHAVAAPGMTYINCFFTNTIFDYFKRYCVFLQSTGGILSAFRFDASCWFMTWETQSIALLGSTGINDNHIFSGYIPISGADAIYYAVSNAEHNTFDSIVVDGCNQTGSAFAALLVAANSAGFTVTNVKGNGPNSYAWTRPDYGIIVGTNCDNFIVSNCSLRGVIGGYSFANNSSGAASRRVVNNLHANYAGNLAKSVPASGTTYINTSPFVEEWNLFGGTLTTGYDKNGLGFPGALQSVHMRLQPGDSFTVGYSVAPTARVFAEP